MADENEEIPLIWHVVFFENGVGEVFGGKRGQRCLAKGNKKKTSGDCITIFHFWVV